MKTPFVQIVAAALATALPIAMPAQNLTGTVVADDTGEPITGATVIATQKTASPSQRAVVYKGDVGPVGQFALTAAAGQYQLCVHGADPYLDPCQWGDAPGSRSVAAAGTAPVSLRLQKGGQFIVRVHDRGKLLSGVETVAGAGVRAYVTGAAVRQFPLPLLYRDDRVREYGALVPINSPLTVVVQGRGVALVDSAGVAPNPQGVPFRISKADVSAPRPIPHLEWMFPRSSAKVYHVYTLPQR